MKKISPIQYLIIKEIKKNNKITPYQMSQQLICNLDTIYNNLRSLKRRKILVSSKENNDQESVTYTINNNFMFNTK
jgi:ribosomal protein S25